MAKDILAQEMEKRPVRALTNGNAGNPRAGRKPWARALDIEVMANPDLLRKLARKTFAMGLRGNLDAIKEIANRLDGKAVQATEVSVSGSVAMFQGMSREELIQAVRDRLSADPKAAQALGFGVVQAPLLRVDPEANGEATAVIEHVAVDPVR